jgi:hypothetical protein
MRYYSNNNFMQYLGHLPALCPPCVARWKSQFGAKKYFCTSQPGTVYYLDDESATIGKERGIIENVVELRPVTCHLQEHKRALPDKHTLLSNCRYLNQLYNAGRQHPLHK